MAASSETQIVNNALLRLGSSPILALGVDTNTAGTAANQIYSITRDALLRKHFWNFAVTRVELAADDDAPTFEYSYQYTLPSDFIRMVRIYDQTDDYKIEGTKILTNMAAPLQVAYVQQVTDVSKFDSLFVDVLVLMLAIKMGPRLAGDGFNSSALQQELQSLLLEGKVVDAQDSSPDQFEIETWVDARRNGAGSGWWSSRFE